MPTVPELRRAERRVQAEERKAAALERIARALGGEAYPHQAEHLAWLIDQDEQAMLDERQRGARVENLTDIAQAKEVEIIRLRRIIRSLGGCSTCIGTGLVPATAGYEDDPCPECGPCCE